jgi:hypothetical protein
MRNLLVHLLLPLLLGGLILGCEKPDLDECRRACWNGMKVKFWAQVDRDVKSMSVEEAAKYRASMEIKFQNIAKEEEDPGLMNCTYDCQHNSNDKQIACMKEAKTEAALEKCMQ